MNPIAGAARTERNPSPPPPADANGFVEWSLTKLWRGFTYIPGSVLTLWRDWFVDGNHPWKQTKYILGLYSIENAFVTNKQPLLQIKTSLAVNPSSDCHETFINTIMTLTRNVPKEKPPRQVYRDFIDNLRETISLLEKANQLNSQNPYGKCILDICFYRFTEVQIYCFCEKLIHLIIREGLKKKYKGEELEKKLALNPLTLDLEEQFECIDLTPQSLKAPKTATGMEQLKGAANVGFDAQRRSNMPYVLYDIAGEQSFRVIRTGCPTMQRCTYATSTYSGEATITPEFKTFIRYLAEKNKKLLFISLQNEFERPICDERERNIALRALAKEFPDNFLLIILSHDSDFYLQKNQYATLEDASAFKNEFWRQMNSPDCGFYLPAELFQNHLKDILDEVHEDFFDSKKTLSLQERRNFIELYYTRITLEFIKAGKIDYLINCCKDSIDRAGIRNTILHYFFLILLKKEHLLHQMFAYLHAAPFLVKKQSMIHERKSRLLPVIEMLQSETVREKLRQRVLAQFSIDDIKMVLDEQQAQYELKS